MEKRNTRNENQIYIINPRKRCKKLQRAHAVNRVTLDSQADKLRARLIDRQTDME